MYIYVTEQDVKEMSSVQDEELNKLLQEAREIDDRILVSEDYAYRRKKGYKGWLLGEKEKYFEYQLYVESRAHDGSPYQAQYCMCASNYHTIFAYLCGVINHR